MDRRNFIRVGAGGVVAAAAGTGMSACSSDFPSESLVAWQGPDAAAELRRWALGYALLAPNSHNRQPWLVDLREPDAISLYVDRARLLPMTDPWYRQIMVSQGTFIEALVLALRERAIEPLVQLFPQGEFKARELDDRPVARLSWVAGALARKDPLFAQLSKRHTAKVEYDLQRPVAVAALDALRSVVTDPGVSCAATVDPHRTAALRSLCLESARVEISTPRTMLESLQLTRVGNDEIIRHRDGISVNQPLARFAAWVGAFDRSAAPPEGSIGFKQILASYEGFCKTAMGFFWLSTPTASHVAAGTARSAEVNAGRAFMRVQLKATELGLQLHPMSQAPQEFAEMRPLYDQMHSMLLGRPAREQTVQMLCRVGYCAPQQHTPRRALDGFLRG